MKALLFIAALLFSIHLAWAASPPDRVTILRDDFEAANALNQWEIAPSAGRARIVEDPRNSTNHGLLLDDVANDTVFSQNVVSRKVSIAGHAGIRIALDIFSFNDEANVQTNAFDGLILRGGGITRVYTFERLAEQRFEIEVDYGLEVETLRRDGVITIELHQYDNSSAPDDGLFFDNVTVTGLKSRDLVVEAPLSIRESDPLTVTALIWPIPTESVQLELWDAWGQTRFGHAIYPAGAAFAELTFTGFDNAQLNGNQTVAVLLTDGHFASQVIYLTVLDDEFSGLSLAAPVEIVEGERATGTVTITAPHNNWINIPLTSSDPSVVVVPSVVQIGNGNAGQFEIRTFENRRILPDREATVTATLGTETVQWKIKVKERNSLAVTFDGPLELVEGASGNYFFAVNAISDQPLTVAFTASPASVAVSPASVTLPPGQNRGLVSLSVTDDAAAQGDRAFQLTARVGTVDSVFTGTILDNEIAGFAFDMPERMPAGVSMSILMRAVNHNGSTVEAFSGAAKIYLKDKQGVEQLVSDNVLFSAGKATVGLAFPYTARGSVLVARSQTGISGESAALVLFSRLNFGATDMVWDARRQKLYAISAGAALPGHLHSVTPIDPVTGEIGTPLFLGGEPHVAAITDTGKYLYVALKSAGAVRRIDLDTFTSVASIVLKSDAAWNTASFYAYDLLTVPGRPLDFISSQFHTGSSFRDTRMYVNGAMQNSSSWDAMELAPSGAANEFFGFDSHSTAHTLTRFRILPNGFEPIVTQRAGLISGYGDISAGNDLIFSSNGRVVDGRKMEILGDVKFPIGWMIGWDLPRINVTADVPKSRVYYTRGRSIAGYDTGVYQLVSESEVPTIGNISKLVRWGDTGIALLTQNAELVILEDDRIVPTGASTDVSVTLSATTQPILLDEAVTYTATVTNVSTNNARKVRVSFDLSAGQEVTSVNSAGFVYSGTSTNVVVDIGDLAPGTNHTIRVTAKVTALATLVTSVSGGAASLDADYANNKATSVVNVGFASTPNSVNVVKMSINDVIVRPGTSELIVSTAATAPFGAANRIMLIDPMSGLVTKSILTPGEPAKLAVSEDGTTVYAISAARTSAYRVNLATGQFVQTISFNLPSDSVAAYDIEVLPGTTNSIIIASGWYGVRVYDNGVFRGQATSYYTGSTITLLPDPKYLYGQENSSVYKYEISAAGVSKMTEVRDLASGAMLESDGYYVYGEYGRVVRADLMVQAGVFDLERAFPQGVYSMLSVEPERARRRAYFARDKYIASFDSESYLRLRTVNFGLPSTFTSLERWGTDGFAARLENGNLAIIRSDLVPEELSGIDLIVSLPNGEEVTSPSVTISGQAFHGQGIANVKINGKDAQSSGGWTNWFGIVDSLIEGENTIIITATSLGAPAETRTIARTVIYRPDVGGVIADAWITQHFSADGVTYTGAHTDQDGDGQSNLREYLFGTDPLMTDKPVFTIGCTTDGQMSVQMMRRNTAAVDFIVEGSTSLSVWESLGGPAQTVAAGSDYSVTTYNIAGDSNARFFRVRAVLK